MFYLYVLINKINNKIYVGQTENFERRRREHKSYSRYFSKGTPLYCSIKKYGFANFEMFPIEIANTAEEIDKLEIYWIKEFDSTNRKIGYNLCPGGKVNRGNKWTEEQRKKHSELKKAYYKNNPEVLAKLNKFNKGVRAHNAKYSELVPEIRNIFLTCQYKIEELADKFKMDSASIRDICFNKNYHDANYLVPENVIEFYKSIKGMRKISKQQVSELRTAFSTGNYTVTELAQKYKLSVVNTSDIIKNKVHNDPSYSPPKKKDHKSSTS